MRIWNAVKALGSVALARIRQLADIWSTSTTDVIVIGLMAWCALVLQANPTYLSSSPRLRDLQGQFPAAAWEAAFITLVVYQSLGLLFGSEDQPLGVVNPLMRTEKQALIWKCIRMAGWLFSMFFNFLIALIISKQGWLNFGTGFFGFAAGLSCIAFSVPFRMLCADIRTGIDRRNHRIRIEQIRSAVRSSSSRTVR